MRTAVLSDFHLGVTTGTDIGTRHDVLERLLAAVADADHVVLLGDVLELRELPLAEALDRARPLFAGLGEALAGRRVTIVPGNHDYHLAEPWLTRMRLGGGELGPTQEWAVEPTDGTLGRIASWMGDAEVRAAYPGLFLRRDVYALHGHYLDLHLTVPRLESLAASAMRRLIGRGAQLAAPADYEAALAPLYAFHFALAQGAVADRLRRGGSFSRAVWSRVDGSGGGSPVTRFLLGRVTIPGAVAGLNRLGLGPFGPDLSGAELRRSGLRAIGAVVDALGVRAEHVVFGHTHRAGPLPGDDLDEWVTPGGARLWGTGTWHYERMFLRSGQQSPYWPGTVVWVEEEGPPRVENALEGVELVPG